MQKNLQSAKKKLLVKEMEHWRRTDRTSKLKRKTVIENKNQFKIKIEIITKIGERRLSCLGPI